MESRPRGSLILDGRAYFVWLSASKIKISHRELIVFKFGRNFRPIFQNKTEFVIQKLNVTFQQPEKRPTAKVVSNHLMRLEKKLENLEWWMAPKWKPNAASSQIWLRSHMWLLRRLSPFCQIVLHAVHPFPAQMIKKPTLNHTIPINSTLLNKVNSIDKK